MEELLTIAESSSPLPIRKIVENLFKKNVETANLPQEKIDEFINLVFDLISQNRTICSQQDWDRLRFLLIMLVISLSPANTSIPPISVNTNDGPLFSILLTLQLNRNDLCDSINNYVQAFYQGLKTFDYGFDVKTFYSISHCYYLQLPPTLLNNNLKPEQFSELVVQFFNSISRVKPQSININFISFAADMFRQITHHIMKHNLLDMTPDFIQAFKDMLDICSSCPNIILLNLLHPWYALVKFTMDQKQRNVNYNFQDQIEQLTTFFEKVAAGKYHELHRGFSWYIAIYFFRLTKGREQQTRVLLLICHAFRSVLRLEGMSRVPQATKEIRSLICSQRNTEGSWALFHILTSCESTLSINISDIKKIHGIRINPKCKSNELKKRTIKFSEQIFEDESNVEIDCELSTKIEELQFPDFESAKECFTKQVDQLYLYLTRLLTGIKFHFLFVESILNDLQSDENFTSSVAFYYITNLIKLGIKLMIVAAQRITMLEQFNYKELLSNRKKPSQPSTNSNVSSKIPSFSIICRPFMEFTKRIPMQYYPLLAKEIASMLYRALEKGQISFLFIKFFSFLDHSNDGNIDISPLDTLYSHVLCKLMEIASLHLNDFLAHSAAKSKLIFNLILFIIRIGKPNDSSSCHPCLKVFLKTFYKLIFNTIISNIKKTSNQIYALKMLRIYLSVTNGEYNRNKNFKFRSVQKIYDDIQIFAKKESLSPLLRIPISENDAVNVPSLLSLLEAALLSENPEHVKSASDFCLTLFNPEKPIDSTNLMVLQLYKSWFKSIIKLPQNEAIKITEFLPEYAACFNQPLIPPSVIHVNLIHKETGFNLFEILNEAAFNMQNDKDEVANLFILIVDCFELLKQKIKQKEANLKEPMRKLLLYLCYCSNFDFLKEKVENYLNDLIDYFLEIFAKGESSLFLISLISISGSSRSESSKYAVLLCITFLERAKAMNVSIELFKATIDEMMSFFNPQMRLFSMLYGLSLFTRFVPESVSLNIMRTFFISSNEFYTFDNEFTVILNKMLKQFLQSKTREEQVEFVYMSYDILSHTLLNSSLVLLKRLSKLGICLPIHDCNELLENNYDYNSSTPVNPLIVFQKLSAALMCGIESPIVLSDKMKQMINNFIKSKNDGVPVIELSRKMSLHMSIIRSPETFKDLSADPGFVKNVLGFFINTLSSRYMRKNAIKALKILVTKYNDEYYSSRQIEVYCSSPSKIFKFFSSHQDGMSFYRHLTKIIPSKIPPSIAKDFLDSVFEYVDFDDSKKFALLTNLVHFVKYLSIENFIKLEPVQSIILAPYNEETSELTYLQMFIEKIMILYQHREIPYYSIINKYVARFLKIFPKETVEFIVQIPPKCDAKISYDFLTDLIENDDSHLFFNTFIYYIETNKEALLNINHPSFFRILHKLSKKRCFAELTEFQSTLDRLLFSFISNTIHTEASKRAVRLFSIIMDIGYAELNTFRSNPSIDRLFKFTKIFNLPSIINTHLYRRYVTIIFKKGDQQFIAEIVKFIMQTKPKISPKVFEIILGHSLKYLNDFDEDILNTLWEFLSNKIGVNQTNLTELILVCIIRLLQKNIPQDSYLKNILKSLQKTISSPDTHIVLYSIKLASELVKLNLMPPKIYFQIVQLIFSYVKFFDLPYSNYTYKFLKMSSKFQSIPKEVEDSVIEAISYFPHDKFANVREMKRFIDIFTEVPQFLIGLPFSLISTLALYLEGNLQKKSKNEIIEIDPIIVAGIKFCSTVKPSQIEIDRFIKTCFLFFRFLVTQASVMKDFPDAFFEYILKNGCTEFPIDLLHLVQQTSSMNNSYRFAFVSCASKFVPNELCKEEYFEMIEGLFEYLKDVSQTINNNYLLPFLDFVTSKSGLIERFHPMITAIVDSWIESPVLNETTRDRFIMLCNAMILGSPNQNRLSYLLKIYDFVHNLPNIPSNQLLISSLFRFVISCLDYIPIHQQLTYLDFIVTKVVNNPEQCFFFISVLPILFDSESISNQVKNQLLTSLPDLFTKVSVESFDDIIDSINKYAQKVDINVNIYITSILLSQCKFASHSNRLIYLKRIMDLIPNITFEEFIKFMPIIFWSNEFLAITTALITPDEWPIWCSIFAFSNRLINISDQLAAASFSRLVNHDNSHHVVAFFSAILTAKPHHQYSQVSLALLQCFSAKGISISTSIVEKAIKHQDYQVYLPHFLNDTIPSQYFLMPHILNDPIFGHFLSALNPSEASAIALTFLNEYQAAESIYMNSFQTAHPLFDSVMKVNSHFTSIYKEESDASFESFLRPLCSINQESDAILIKINEAVQSFLRKEGQPLETLFEAETMNLKSLQKRRTLSLFEKERIATIGYSIRIIKRHIQSLKNLRPSPEFEKAVSPAFLRSLNSIRNFLDGNPPNQMPAIAFDGDGAVLLDPSLSEDFACISAITSRGLLVVGKSQIDSYLLTMSLKISENQITVIDWCKFAHFSFNVFLAQPSLDLFQVTFGVYSQIILLSQSNDNEILPFIKVEAAARIISLIRIVIESSDADMAMIVTTNSGIFKREYFEIWKPWLVQIIDLAKTNWFCSIVSDITKETMYKSYIYCEKLGCKRIAESLNPRMDPISPLLVMTDLEKVFDNIFLNLDFQKLYREVLLNNNRVKEALEFKNSGRVPQNFFEFASTQIDFDEFNKLKDIIHDDSDFFSENNISEIEKMGEIVKNFNKLLPLTNPPTVLYKVYDDLRKLSSNFVVFFATTSSSSKETFLIQRSHNYDKNGYSTSIVTISNIAQIIKKLFNACYQSRIRSINLNIPPIFEVGHKYIIVPFGDFGSSICASTLFASKIKMTHQKWIQLKMKREKEEFSFNNSPNSFLSPMSVDPNIQKYNFSLSPNILLDHLTSMTTTNDFIQIRSLFLRCYAAKSSIRYMFNAPYPKLGRTFIPVSKITTPLLISDFEVRYFTDLSNYNVIGNDNITNILLNESSFRLAPNFTTLFGPSYRGEFLMSFASSMIALSSRIEIIRACFEILVADPSAGIGGVTPSNLLMNRNKLEEKLLEASPPTGSMVNEDDCVIWFDKLTSLITQAENPDIQNPYAIPWF